MPKLLIGFMGSGKSTVAKLLDPSFIDMDSEIERRIGMTIADYFENYGEAQFRVVETSVLKELLELPDRQVIATGGGVVTRVANRSLLLENKKNNIFLSASFELLYDRIENDKQVKRPLFLNHTKKEFYRIFKEREQFYREVAGQVISIDGLTLQEIVRKIE